MSQPARPRIDFYKLDSRNSTSIIRFCCLLADKVVKTGNTVFVRTRTAAETRLLDDMMWTFNDSSFLAHDVQSDAMDSDAPVIIGHSVSTPTTYLLINLGNELPKDIERYERVAEIINDVPEVLKLGRAHYSAYKKAAYPLHYHEITA